jgi:HK97 family phage portal protein
VANLLQKVVSRSTSSITLDQWASFFDFNGLSYPYLLHQTYSGTNVEEPTGGGFEALIYGAYRSNGVVFACMLARMLLFSEARFQWQQMRNGRPGKLYGNTDLAVIEKPWPGGVTGDLLTRAIQDADLAGSAFCARRGTRTSPRIKRMRPDWTTIVLGSHLDPSETMDGWDIDAEVVGYLYHEGGYAARSEPVTLLREEVAHFAPIPDPLASYRGMSWLTPIVREITADSAATQHKLKFFQNGATPNLVISLDASLKTESFKEWMKMFSDKHEGVANAYRTLYLGGGASAQVIGSNLRQMDFKVTQAAGETRIAAAAGVPPIIVGLSEGLQAATYSNYGQARRRFADGTIRPLWRNFAGSLEVIVPPPANSRLWYDDRDIPFLTEDKKDLAEVQQANAVAIRALVDSGFEAGSVVDAITANDLSQLKHTGLFSVQLQAPGSNRMPAGEVDGQTPVGGDPSVGGPLKYPKDAPTPTHPSGTEAAPAAKPAPAAKTAPAT